VNSRSKGPTLKDVAERAGVSTATVARVLHKNGYVAEETRQQVQAVISDTGYQINAVAQGLRKQRTFTLGHVLQSIAPNPFFAGVAVGVEQEAAAHGCGVVLYTTQGDPERERMGVETLIRRRVDAIIFTKIAHESNVEVAARAGVPVVQVERISSVPTHSVTADNYHGSLEATRHLIELGHRRIAFLGVAPSPMIRIDPERGMTNSTVRRTVESERLAGYLDAMAAGHVPVCDDLVDLGGTYYALDWARTSTRRLLALPASRRPTAVFATCDMLAAGALQEIHVQRMGVPDDISVVGFDDTYASYLTPPLTTARQPMLEMGQAAARLAIEALQAGHEHGASRHARLRTELVVRFSTGRVASNEISAQ
jgi:DNA-binding LacI/PurR family transcriptional regulator